MTKRNFSYSIAWFVLPKKRHVFFYELKKSKLKENTEEKWLERSDDGTSCLSVSTEFDKTNKPKSIRPNRIKMVRSKSSENKWKEVGRKYGKN